MRLTDWQTRILRQAEILVSPASLNQAPSDRNLEDAAAYFQKEKYGIVREILPPVQLAAIRRYFKELLAQGFMMFNDKQVSLRHAIHNDALSIYFHEQLAPLVSRIVGERVKPSYVYSATYVEDAVLLAHTDRPQCEFTMSMQIGYEPELKTGEASPWPLCLDDLHENRIEAFLANGDAMIYKVANLFITAMRFLKIINQLRFSFIMSEKISTVLWIEKALSAENVKIKNRLLPAEILFL